MKKLINTIRTRIRIRRQHCVLCGDDLAPWVHSDVTYGEVRLCDWHNAQITMVLRVQPVRREVKL